MKEFVSHRGEREKRIVSHPREGRGENLSPSTRMKAATSTSNSDKGIWINEGFSIICSLHFLSQVNPLKLSTFHNDLNNNGVFLKIL